MASATAPRTTPGRRLLLPRMVGALVTLIGALALIVGAGAAPSRPDLAVALAADSSGPLSMSNSNDGGAIMTMSGMAPGDSGDGEVTITNSGTEEGDFALSPSDISDTPGMGGGELSQKLLVTIAARRDSGVPHQLYEGPLDEMGTLSLGRFEPGEARSYYFEVAFPDGGTPASATSGDNAYQGAVANVEYQWTATSAGSPAPTPVAPANPVPSTPESEPARGDEPAETVPPVYDSAPPRLTLSSRALQRPMGRRAMVVGAHCDVACSVQLAGRVSVRGGRAVRIGPTRATLPAGQTARLRLPLSRRALAVMRRSLSGRRRVRMAITATATTAEGNSVGVRRTITLRGGGPVRVVMRWQPSRGFAPAP